MTIGLHQDYSSIEDPFKKRVKAGFESYASTIEPHKSNQNSIFNVNMSNDYYHPAKYEMAKSEYYQGSIVEIEDDEQEMPSISEMIPIYENRDKVVVQMY